MSARTLLAIIAPARPAALAVSDPRRLSSWGSYRRLSPARRRFGPSGAETVIVGVTVPNTVAGGDARKPSDDRSGGDRGDRRGALRTPFPRGRRTGRGGPRCRQDDVRPGGITVTRGDCAGDQPHVHHRSALP